MSPTHPCFLGRYLPASIWDAQVLHLPAQLALAHREFLEKKEWLADYNGQAHGTIGGRLAEDAKQHVINRFLNSAARMQFVCSDPNDEHAAIRDMVLDQMADGHIHILDLAAGNGAGTLAMLSLLCELRTSRLIPKLPLNVAITGIDFSPDALGYYAEILDGLSPWFAEAGLHVELKLALCDLTVPGEFNEELEEFFESARHHDVCRFLCVVSALSGAKKEGLEEMHASLTMAAAQLSHSRRNSSWLWVEPYVGKLWITTLIDSVSLTLRKIKHRFLAKTDSFSIKTLAPMMEGLPARNFSWKDPYNGSTATSKVVVAAFKNR